MTISLADMKFNYEEADLPGEIYDYDPAVYAIELNTTFKLSPHTILKQLIFGCKEPDPFFWVMARNEYNDLNQNADSDAIRLWKLINDMAYMTEIFELLKNKPDNAHWVDMYRKSYQRLERIVHTYTNDDLYKKLNKIFDVAETAQELSNELFLMQTRPATEARTFPEIDQYTGIHDEKEDPDYLKIPDTVTLPNAEGVLTEVILTNLQDNDSWGGDLEDTDHDWYEDRGIPSASIEQWETQEYQVTDQYFQLKQKYRPILDEIQRLIDEDPLVKIAHSDNREFCIDSAISKVENSVLVRSFAKSLKLDYREGIPVQDIAALVMELPFDLSINGNIDTVVDMFGDDILDSIIEPAGIRNDPEQVWEQDLARFHEETLTQMEAVANPFSPKLSPQFTTEVFKAIAEDHLPVHTSISRAYDTFRETSKSGSLVYQQAIAAGSTPAQAMKAFYEMARESGDYTPRDRFYRASDDRILVKTASSGYTTVRELSWGLAKYKARQGEIFVPKDAPEKSKRWLFNKLSERNWGKKLIAKLAE